MIVGYSPPRMAPGPPRGDAAGPDIFLSSALDQFMDVRERICRLAPERIWSSEITRGDLDTRKGSSPFTIVDTCLERIGQSQVFICVLRDRYGTSVFEQGQSVSILETEIYRAAARHANAHFFLMHPFNPDPRLSGLLDIVRSLRPGLIPDRVLPEDKVREGIRRIIDDTRPGRRTARALSRRQLEMRLAAVRGPPRPDVEIFDRTFRGVAEKPDLDHVSALLADARSGPSIECRLTRAWVALRELCAAPYDDTAFAEYLPYWDRALSAWTSAAAWYGLHGHLHAGRLAGVNSLLRVRERMGAAPAGQSPDEFIQGTLGGRASEYYSMAKLVSSRGQREEYLARALANLTKAIKAVSGDVSGYLAIRGHIEADQGRLAQAQATFEEMHRLRVARGDTGGIGEALADLGLVHLKLGHTRAALLLFSEGTERLEEAGNFTFALRARKRLALAYLRSARPYRALRELCTAYDKAQEHKVLGQITPLMETIHDWSCRLGLWSRRKDRQD